MCARQACGARCRIMCGASSRTTSASGRRARISSHDLGSDEPIARRREHEDRGVHAPELRANVGAQRLHRAERHDLGRRGAHRGLHLPDERVGRVRTRHEVAHHRGGHRQPEEARADEPADRVKERVQRPVQERRREHEPREPAGPLRSEADRDRPRERLGDEEEAPARQRRANAVDERVVSERRVGREGDDLRARCPEGRRRGAGRRAGRSRRCRAAGSPRCAAPGMPRSTSGDSPSRGGSAGSAPRPSRPRRRTSRR